MKAAQLFLLATGLLLTLLPSCVPSEAERGATATLQTKGCEDEPPSTSTIDRNPAVGMVGDRLCPIRSGASRDGHAASADRDSTYADVDRHSYARAADSNAYHDGHTEAAH